jgi:hypothetical protein
VAHNAITSAPLKISIGELLSIGAEAITQRDVFGEEFNKYLNT